MTTSSITNSATATAATAAASSAAIANTQTLGQADFIKLMTTEMQQQDPTAPVDNKEMIAQMAQFSQVSGLSDVNTNLKDISAKLDALIAQSTAAAASASAAAAAAAASATTTAATPATTTTTA